MSDAGGDAERAAQRALSLVRITLPHLSGLSYLVQVRSDERVPTAGIFPSGKLLINPRWFLGLATTNERAFVLAHELLHLALRSHERVGRADFERFNAAHDLIINDMLEAEMHARPPGGGLRQPGARHCSVESLMADEHLSHRDPFRCSDEPHGMSPLGDALRKALEESGPEGQRLLPPAENPDADGPYCSLSSDLEAEWFPQEGDAERRRHAVAIERAALAAASLHEIEKSVTQVAESTRWGDASGADTAYFSALRRAYRPPWELALHRWAEGAARPRRTYARAPRRGADRTDVVLPGRSRDAWTLSIILDTSGSMTEDLSKALGAIAEFGASAGIDAVRIVQCDVQVTADDTVPIEELVDFAIHGLGGTDLDAAFERLAEDPSVTAAVVITDGWLSIPPEGPFEVLWALTESSALEFEEFAPSYGSVLVMEEAR